jgi:thioredoxin reductase (NADPH)
VPTATQGKVPTDASIAPYFQARVSSDGYFAVGDVTRGLNQIAVATGQAALAATTIHNMLPWALRPSKDAAS